MDEFTIAKNNNCLVIPIASTGGAAEKIWEIMKRENSEYTNSRCFDILKDGKSFDDIYKAVQTIIENYS